MKRALQLLAIVLGSSGALAAAEEVCKSVQLKNPSPTLSDIYAMALGHARAWKPDAVPARIDNTSLGPLQPDGGSAAWNLMFYSESANANVSISTFRGTYRRWAQPGGAGRIPDLKPDFARDGAKLYALARQHGGTLIDQGYIVMIGTAAAPGTRHATWYINYDKDNKSGSITVIVDANTGAVEKVLKD